MDADSRWMRALLDPENLDAPPGDAEPPDDARLVAAIREGRLHDVDVMVRRHELAAGWVGVVRQELPAGYAVTSAMARWIAGFGREDGASDALQALAFKGGSPSHTAVVVLAAIALSTADRYTEAAELLERTVDQTNGASRVMLLTQLGLRRWEGGDTAAALEALDGVGPPDEGVDDLDRRVRAVAHVDRMHIRSDLTPRSPDVTDLYVAAAQPGWRRGGIGDAVIAEDVAAVLLARSGGAGWREQSWDRGFQALLGAWLHHECWADSRAVLAARAAIGRYAVTQTMLPRPAGWTHLTADASDLDLLRRGGDAALAGQVIGRWWESGPTVELTGVVGRAVHGLGSAAHEHQAVSILTAAGDLLEGRNADLAITLLVFCLTNI